jgi:hypothetical protein
MSSDLGLEQRYRRVLRLLPGYYRDKWEEDMVAAFLDSWLTGDPDEDDAILEYCEPTWPEVVSVAGLAVRLYLGGAGAPRRYFAWGQAVRRAVLIVVLVHAEQTFASFVFQAWSRRLFGLPAPPAYLGVAASGVWPAVFDAVGCAWIVIFAALVLGHYRTAQVIAVLAIVPRLVFVLHVQLTGAAQGLLGAWAFWILFDLVPVLAMAAFHRNAPSAARWRWLLALPASYLLVGAPVLAIRATANFAWLPDFSGLCCLLVALACLAHAPGAWSRRAAGSGVWSLTLTLLAAVAGAYRIISLTDYLNDPHLIAVSLAELLILAAAVALLVPDAARAQTAAPALPPRPHPGYPR